MDRTAPIYVAGHTGLIGSAIVRRLRAAGHENLILRNRSELDLRDALEVRALFRETRPSVVFLAAGRTGGIMENLRHPVALIEDNLAIQLNVLSAASEGAGRLFFFASSCIYPRECAQPMNEDRLLTGPLEPTSLAYAAAKIAGVQQCLAYNTEARAPRFIPLIPNSTYGPGDNFDPDSAHVLAALLRRFHLAQRSGDAEVLLWGSGDPEREFVHADDVAGACYHLLDCDLSGAQLPLNVGTGAGISIRDLARLIADVVGYTGTVSWDRSRPNGAPRKVLDVGRLSALGWKASIALEQGIRQTYQWMSEHESEAGVD